MSPARHGRQHCRDDGFTMVEVLVVLAILSFSIVTLLPGGRGGRPGMVVRAVAVDVASTLKSARAAAIRSGVEQAVVIDTVAGTVATSSAWDARPITPPIEVALLTIRGEQTSAAAGRLRFYPDGSSTGGRVTLRNGRHAATVTVDWMTGATRVDVHD